MRQIQILTILLFGFILPSLKSKYILVQLQDEIIGCRNQDNDFLGSIGKIKPRDNDEDGVSPDECVNTRDNGVYNCTTQLKAGESCQDFLKWKDCDRACNLCACSTASGTIKEHCSGHGTCRANCTQNSCTNAKCQCYPGWSGDVCQNQIPCTPKDSDACIQNAETWDSEYVCANLQQGKPDHEYCDSYSKDAKRCCPDACGNTEDFTESVCKASSGSGKCKYPNEAQCSSSYSCQDGQGEFNKSMISHEICDITQCKENCTNNLECMGFDFTTDCKVDSCRLYPKNTATRRDPGNDGRKYCKRTEGNGTWGDWHDWEDCPVSCGGAYQKRTRLCDSPAPEFGGNCTNDGSSGSQTRRCNRNPCPIFFDYTCGNRHCDLMNYTEDVDYGYYYTGYRNDDCTFCKDKCTNDTNCAGVECGPQASYCFWWKQGICVTELWPNNSKTFVNDTFETCIKIGTECGKSRISSARIIGGVEVAPHSIPWQVAIFDHKINNWEPQCGGTLISRSHVLSAAHCFEEPNNCSRYSVGLGMHNHDVSDGMRVDIHHISNHPNYRNICGMDIPENDFSILHFASPIEFNKTIIPACYPDKSFGGDFLDGKDLTVSGWGTLMNGSYPENLHKATLPGVTNEVCKRSNDDFSNCTYITANTLCAGDPDNRKASQGFSDSGGSIQCPLTYKNNGGETVVGVVSWVKNCSDALCNDTLSVFARVTAQLEWIEDEMEKTYDNCSMING